VTAPVLELCRCEACQNRFLPNEGPCPRCGGTRLERYAAPGLGTVLAATELEVTAEGWEAPHRLALVEVADAVRLIAAVDGELPSAGSPVEVRPDGPIHRARAAEPSSRERGEGDSPKAGSTGAPFEPPR
jgi:uncharacterized OB-fold protein